MDNFSNLNIGDFRENLDYLRTKMIAMAGEGDSQDLEDYINKLEDMLKI